MKNGNIVAVEERKVIHNKLFIMKFRRASGKCGRVAGIFKKFFFLLAEINGSSECGSSEENSKIRENHF